MPFIESSSKKAWTPKPQPFEFSKRTFNYNNRKWRELSKRFRQAHPLCAECERQGRITQGRHCDHIKSIQDGGDPYDWNNLQTLCIDCHIDKTNNEINHRCSIELSQDTIDIEGIFQAALSKFTPEQQKIILKKLK